MRFSPLPLSGAFRIEDEAFVDDRGRFSRIFCARELKEIGLEQPLAQSNLSLTRHKGAVRGMHFQRPPHAEIKIVRCLQGAVFDVIVDLRKGSDTFLQWHGEILSPDKGCALFIPEGFAHGFQVLEEESLLLYMHSEFYTPSSEGGVRFSDPAINIEWPLPLTDISERDTSYPLINDQFEGIDI
ncbi:dTDP-4-dehydrorhamnose 3,5-epimerase [uncultured Pseudodesulfovibrio sp.]|uniref:dTDP-4-dehydrorhamnose 3,5-epimerase n=1 Tax=uncultured Pseudodesulfovibrio sp. TaxID=2035858 RepID=UPI0029C87901|nr:dTDP-4-dehydrorhamnose 3,5-epimerase [uncultured Pseudodesulfovibrio sp.]